MGESLVAGGFAAAGRTGQRRSGGDRAGGYGMSAVATRQVPVWQSKIKSNVRVAGSGSPVVYFHGAGGLVWDGFLDTLASRHTVYAPEFPGTSPGDPD